MKRDSLIAQAKEELRREMRARLRAMTPHLRAEASLVICQMAAHLPAFAEAKCVALFAPLPSEPDIHPLIEEAWARGKRVVLPRMMSEGEKPRLTWHAVTSWSQVIEPGPFGLREPEPEHCPMVKTEEVDCTFTPGLAFDRHGFRLGRGGGYYDCFLGEASATMPRIGLMFACQGADTVPSEPHDQALSCVVTEEGLTSF